MALVFKSVVTTFFLEDEEKAREKAVTASWVAREGGSGDDNVDYQLTITKESTLDEHLSLFALGVQSTSHAVEIFSASGFNVRFYKFGAATPFVPGPPFEIKKMTPNLVYMIAFSGQSCVLQLRAKGRSRIGPTKWKTGGSPFAQHVDDSGSAEARSHHDNMPPGGTTEK